jgi:multidrug resistance protein
MPDMDSRSESGTEVQEEERINDNHYRDDEPEEKPSPRLGPQDHRKENSSDDTTQDIEKASPAESQDYEVKWEENDPHNPKNMNTIRKWVVVLIVSASSLCVTCASSIYTSTYAQLESEFHVYQIVATLGLSLFVFGLGLGPMLAAPLSEFYGRRIIYIISLALFVVWLIPCAVAQNIQTMLVARFINGFIGASFLSVAGGTVGDMFDRKHLSAPMMVFTASPFLGPEVGPIMGGFINYYTTWRWSFYVEIIWSSVMLALIVLFVPETYSPVLLRRRAQRLRAQTRDERWKAPIEKMKRTVSMTVLRSLYRPFLLLVFEPMVLNLCLLSALLLGIVYLSFGAFTLIFQTNYGFNLWQTGVSFLGLFVGLVIGISTDPLWQKNYHRLVKRDGGPQPEHRLPPTIAGAIICPIGLFWFAWTT